MRAELRVEYRRLVLTSELSELRRRTVLHGARTGARAAVLLPEVRDEPPEWE